MTNNFCKKKVKTNPYLSFPKLQLEIKSFTPGTYILLIANFLQIFLTEQEAFSTYD